MAIDTFIPAHTQKHTHNTHTHTHQWIDNQFCLFVCYCCIRCVRCTPVLFSPLRIEWGQFHTHLSLSLCLSRSLVCFSLVVSRYCIKVITPVVLIFYCAILPSKIFEFYSNDPSNCRICRIQTRTTRIKSKKTKTKIQSNNNKNTSNKTETEMNE